MGAILAGPIVASCPGDNLLACLRERAVAPAEPPRPAGWIEAVATEYAPPPPAAATLSAPAGRLTATAVPRQMDAAPTIALAPAGGDLAALGAAPGEGVPPATAALTAPAGSLAAGPVPAAPAPLPATATLAAPAGSLAAGPVPAVPPVSPATATLTAPAGSLAASPAPAVAPTLPKAELKSPEQTISSPFDAPTIEAKLTSPPIRYNPAFPNVVVLPAPNTGPDSSIRTLDID
jgi:hypothetical protein